MQRVKSSLIAVAFGFSTMIAAGSVQASDTKHFQSIPSETLEEAVSNFSEYNNQMAKVLEGKLDAKAIFEIHEITYTLEVALEKINDELSELAELLEEVHKATERNDAQTTLIKGQAYLETSRKVIK